MSPRQADGQREAGPGGLSSPGKPLWPDAGLTKLDLWTYYTEAAGRLLPHLAGRPLTLKRFPDGLAGQGFFQKNLSESAPDSLGRFRTHAESSRRDVTYAVVRTVDDLRWCAQVAALELHPWFARVDRPDRSDVLAFDLDPPGEDEAKPDAVAVTVVAGWLRDVLDGLGLASLVKTSGKRGLHLYVPIERRYSFDELRGFGLGVARCCAAAHPDDLTVEMRKARREGRLLLDWSRNGPAQTMVSAWSPRATPQATVSMPLHWNEVESGNLDPLAFTVGTALDRDDAWADAPPPQRIERARAALQADGFDCADRNPRSTAPFT